MKRSTIPHGVFAAALTALLGAPASPVAATEVKTFQVQSQQAFLAGTLDGVSIDPTGRLQLADRAERVTAVDEPFLLSAAEHPDGWVVGTGNDGKVLLVTPEGTIRELFSAGEGQVFAIHADPDGTVWAGLSPGGAIYRIDPDAGPDAGVGEGTEAGGDGEQAPAPWFETGETYVWDLARSADGALLAATGTSGKLFRITGDGAESGEGEVLYDSNDTHVRALLARKDGSVVLGTAGEGLILRLASDGSVRTLHDATQPEVVAFAEGPTGALYAAVIASEASQVDLSAAAAAAQKGGSGDSGDSGDGPGSGPHGGGGGTDPTEGVVQVQVSAGAAAAGSRPAGFSGKRTQILSISPAGVVETAWGFDDETVFDLLWARDRLWVATGLEGKLYSFDGEHMVLEQDLDERQVVSLLPDAPGPAFATTNAPALYRLSGTRERTGTYTSAALDAGNVARFGTLRWWGDTPSGSSLELSLRSGVSSEPDATWSEWTEPAAPSPDGELTVEGLPRGRYVQWRVTLEAGDDGTAGPKIDGVELAYRQSNLRPEISAFETLDPGQIIVPAGFNPTLQVFEPVHPNREGIFTTLEEAAASGNGRTKTLWKKGYRSFRWQVADPNGDTLTYALEFRPLYPEAGERRERAGRDEPDAWMPVAEDLADDHYSFDATVLPDGVYRFRLLASDEEENAPGEGLVSDQISEPVVVDHSPPRLVQAERDGDVVRAVIEDSHNPLRSAEVSVDAGEWSPAPAADGILDARRERLEVEIPADARLLLVRVVDAAYNVVTLDLTDRL